MKIPNVKALVPMKGHSERVPNKNIRSLAGKPAFHWIIETLSNSIYINEIIINTDSDEIAQSANDNFDVTILKRPDFLLGDLVSIQPLIEYDLSQSDGEYFLQTHCTNPLVTTKTIDNAIETFFKQKNHDTLFSVTEIRTRFYWPSGEGINHNPKQLIRTQDLEPILEENSCFYIFSRYTNECTQNRLGLRPLMYPINPLEAVDIDEMEDFHWAEYLLCRKFDNE
jgi:CMP-N-acetylneuraminic acid synthetase